MDQAARPTSGAAAEVVFLEQEYPQTSECCVPRDAGAVDAAANYDNIIVKSSVRHQGLVCLLGDSLLNCSKSVMGIRIQRFAN